MSTTFDLVYYSEDRPYNLPEDQYDQMYNRTLTADAVSGAVASFRTLCGNLQIGPFRRALEIGCGTGRFTIGMIGSGLVAEALITDASSTFVRLTQRKLAEFLPSIATEVLYGVLNGEDCGNLDGDFDLVVMWAALHHFVNWRELLNKIVGLIGNDGVLIMSEPCVEFSMTVAPLLIAAGTNVNVDKDEKDHVRIRQFANVLRFRTQQDYPNLAGMEDKHIFRTDDLYRFAKEKGLTLSILPNGKPPIAHPFGSSEHHRAIIDFKNMAFRRLRFVNGFSEGFCNSFTYEYAEALDVLGYTAANGVGPYFDCVYKLRAGRKKLA
jgi:2-polyprenyl-3-methyl-5-hydroxy-6-metoxy-1,4-benzoquinol methylase